jgi:hypothetical protein
VKPKVNLVMHRAQRGPSEILDKGNSLCQPEWAKKPEIRRKENVRLWMGQRITPPPFVVPHQGLVLRSPMGFRS